MPLITNQSSRIVGFTWALICLTGCGPSASSEQSIVDDLKQMGVLVLKNNDSGFATVVNISVIADKASVSDAINKTAKLSRLTVFNAIGLELSSDDVTTIGRMSTLIELNLTTTNLDDDGLAKLTGLAGLNTLYIAETELTDAGMGSLDRFVNLKIIGLGANTITKPLTALTKLDHLQWIDLSSMAVGDEILAGLADVESLETISLQASTYSQEAFNRLKQARRDIEFKL